MSNPGATLTRWAMPAIVLVAALVVIGPPPVVRGGPVRADADAGTKVDGDARARGLTFSAGVPPDVQEWFSSALSRVNPHARRLIEAVDGQVTVQVHGPEVQAAGFVQPHSEGFVLSVDAPGLRQFGAEIRDHVIAHELGHVVDIALVPEGLNHQLDAGVPRFGACDGGLDAACAAPQERFADTFAKWALNDPIVLSGALSIGYRVAPPSNLALWGEPLAALEA